MRINPWRLGAMALVFAALAACVDDPPTAPLSPDAPVAHTGEDGSEHSHWRFGHLTWVPRPDLGANTVEFTYKNAWRWNGYTTCYPDGTGASATSCSGTGGRAAPGDIIYEGIGITRLAFGDGSTTPVLFYLVTSVNESENWLFATALQPGTNSPNIIHHYASTGPYTASSFRCCRVGGLGNPGSGYGVETVVTLDGNRSPISNLPPIIQVPQGGAVSWAIPAVDGDGDNLRFRNATSAEATGSAFGGSQPTGLTVDATTGVVSWNTAGLPLNRLYWTQQIIEELDAAGNPKGRVALDYLIKVVETVAGNDPPALEDPNSPPVCGQNFVTQVGNTLSIVLTATDPDPGAVVTISVNGLPPGATAPPATGNPASTTVTWTPTASQGGPHVLTYTATDNFGSQAFCSFTITVVTNQAPVADAGADIRAECVDGGADVVLDGTASSDPDGDPLTYTWTDADGNVLSTDATPSLSFGMGTHAVTLTVEDPSGASHSDVVTVSVEDTQAPVVSAAVTPDQLWPPNHKYVAIDISAVVTDACDQAPVLTASIVSSEPDDANGNGDGQTTGDIRVTHADGSTSVSSNADPVVAFDPASDTLEVRAERAGGGEGRSYTITFTAQDASGNIGTTTATIFVPHNR